MRTAATLRDPDSGYHPRSMAPGRCSRQKDRCRKRSSGYLPRENSACLSKIISDRHAQSPCRSEGRHRAAASCVREMVEALLKPDLISGTTCMKGAVGGYSGNIRNCAFGIAQEALLSQSASHRCGRADGRSGSGGVQSLPESALVSRILTSAVISHFRSSWMTKSVNSCSRGWRSSPGERCCWKAHPPRLLAFLSKDIQIWSRIVA